MSSGITGTLWVLEKSPHPVFIDGLSVIGGGKGESMA